MSTTTEQIIIVILQFAPILVILGMIVGVLRSVMHFGDGEGMTSDGDEGVYADAEEDALTEKQIRLEAERVLMQRLARGEITDEDYTTAMARL